MVVTDTVLLKGLRKKVPVPELIVTIADKGLTIFWQCSCTTPGHRREERQTGGVWKKSGISSESGRSHCDQPPDFFQRSFQAQCSFNPSNLDRSCHCRRPIHSLFVTALVRFSSTQCTSSKKKFPCHCKYIFQVSVILKTRTKCISLVATKVQKTWLVIKQLALLFIPKGWYQTTAHS